MTKPLVSVLMPIHNSEATLRSALASLRNQTLRDIQLVLVNDGSTDATPDILEEISAKDPRVKAVHLPRSGIVEALNHGLEITDSSLVARCDADDIVHPRRLEFQYEYMIERPEASVVGCCVKWFPEAPSRPGYLAYVDWLNSLLTHEDIVGQMYVESPLSHPSVMYRRDHIASLGGYRDLGWPEDYDLWLRVMNAGFRFGKVDEVLHYLREHPQRLTWADPRYSVASFFRLKAHSLARGPLAGNRKVGIWGKGITARRLSAHLRREGIQIDHFYSVFTDRREGGRTIRGVAVLSAESIPPASSDYFILVAVRSREGLEFIRPHLRSRGYQEGRDFLLVG